MFYFEKLAFFKVFIESLIQPPFWSVSDHTQVTYNKWEVLSPNNMVNNIVRVLQIDTKLGQLMCYIVTFPFTMHKFLLPPFQFVSLISKNIY